MSPTLNKAKYFLMFISDDKTTRKQLKCLVGTSTNEQLNALTEIFYNIFKKNVNVSSKLEKYLRNNISRFIVLRDPKTSYKKRIRSARLNISYIVSALILCKALIREAVKNEICR